MWWFEGIGKFYDWNDTHPVFKSILCLNWWWHNINTSNYANEGLICKNVFLGEFTCFKIINVKGKKTKHLVWQPFVKAFKWYQTQPLIFPMMKTWMSHGRVRYAKCVNFEHLYLLNVLAFWSKKPLSDHFYHGKRRNAPSPLKMHCFI